MTGPAWVEWSRRRAAWLLALGCSLTTAGAIGSIHLYADLRSDLTELLPAQAASARDADTVTRRVGGWAEETVALYGADAHSLRQVADALAPRLAGIADLVQAVDYRVDEVRAFFSARRWLQPSYADLLRIHNRLQARIRWEKQRANPLFVALDDDDPPPDLQGLVAELEHKLPANHLLERFPDGYFAARTLDPDGQPTDALVLRVRLAGNPNDYERVAALDRAVRAAVAATLAAVPTASLRVDYGGYVASTIFEHDGLAEDLLVATLLVVLAVAAVIAAYFRSLRAIAHIGLPVAVGALATFGIAELAIGHVNTNTAFLGSIVIGNGINVGIILFARYAEERGTGANAHAAMAAAVTATWLATLLAALAAGIAYASLLFTDFRGFKQFGLIGGVGMVCCWLATYAFMPALVLWWDDRRGSYARACDTRSVNPRRPWLMAPLAALVTTFPRSVLTVGTALAVAAGALGIGFVQDPIEYDFGNLRDSRSLQRGGPAFWEDAVFGGHHDPCIVLANDATEANVIVGILASKPPAGTTIGDVVSVATFVPSDQERKIAVLLAIRELLTPDVVAALPAADRGLAQIPAASLRAYSAADLPPMLTRRLAERDGTIGAAVLVYPTADVQVWNGHHAVAVARDLRGAALTRPDVPMASSLLVFADVLEAIVRDGPKATLLSLTGVVLLVVALSVRRRPRRQGLRDAAWTLGALVVGLWLFVGAAGGLGIHLNMLSFIALPITIGIGVDYAANIVQRRRASGTSVADCLLHTGGAVALCSLTTVIGYSSLVVAHNRALQSFGVLANIGELACLLVALVLLPAAMCLRAAGPDQW